MSSVHWLTKDPERLGEHDDPQRLPAAEAERQARVPLPAPDALDSRRHGVGQVGAADQGQGNDDGADLRHRHAEQDRQQEIRPEDQHHDRDGAEQAEPRHQRQARPPPAHREADAAGEPKNRRGKTGGQ
jgi:hypothetical protein